MRRAGRALVLAALLAAPAAAGAQAGPVLVVGDSLQVGTGPHLRKELAAVPVTVDARSGRPSTEGVRVLRKRLRPNHDVVVFDLGTNDDPSEAATFARNLLTARDLAGDRCLVVATLNRPPVGGVSVADMNKALSRLVEASPNAGLVDWKGAVDGNPSLLSRDGVHATPAGYAARARLVAAAVEECFGAVEPPTKTPRAAPGPEPRAQSSSEPRVTAPATDLSWLIALTPYEVVRGWVQGVADIVTVAAQNEAAVFGPQPPEVELGGS